MYVLIQVILNGIEMKINYRTQGITYYKLTSLINILSSHLSTSGPSSVSALNTANLAINTAEASWSNPADICCKFVLASAQLK